MGYFGLSCDCRQDPDFQTLFALGTGILKKKIKIPAGGTSIVTTVCNTALEAAQGDNSLEQLVYVYNSIQVCI